MRIRWLRWSCALALGAFGLGTAALPVRADVIFSTLGAGGAFNTNSAPAFVVAGSSSIFGATYAEGSSFQPTVGGTVSQIDVAVSTFLGLGNGNFTLQLWSSMASGGSTTIGSMIDSFSVTAGATASLVTVLTPDHPTLVANQTYYLLEFPNNANSLVLWYANSIGATGQIYESKNGVADYRTLTLPAFDVLSAPAAIPEPSTWLLTALTLGVGYASRFRRRWHFPMA